MKTKVNYFPGVRMLAALLVLLALQVLVQAQFTYTTSNGKLTITSDPGASGAAFIPDKINGMLVTAIGPNAF